MADYQKRLIDKVLTQKLRSCAAVVLQGSRGCGKTMTAKQIVKSEFTLASEQVREAAAMMVDMDSKTMLAGDVPRLIDEWQRVPRIWDEVRSEVDDRGQVGQFVLTTSVVPAEQKDISHSGLGRFAWLTMRTMSLFESGDSNGSVSLESLFAGQKAIFSDNPLGLSNIASLVCRGGWPKVVGQSDAAALAYVRDYLSEAVTKDISQVDGVRRNPERVLRFLGACACRVGMPLSLVQLEKDLSACNDSTTVKLFSVRTYLKALRDIYILEELPAWTPVLRTNTAVRVTPDLYFADPSIAAAILKLEPQDLLQDLKSFDRLFKTLCVRDLRVYADALQADVFHYRDKNRLECDAVIRGRTGRIALVNLTLGGKDNIDLAAKKLKTLTDKLATQKPAFLMVLIGAGQYAYRRDDGVFVVPIGCLRP